jgi:TP901 family phage tail tape measure protein
MPDITQKLSFNTRGAVAGLNSLTNKLNEANQATAAFNKTTGKNINTKGLDKAKKKTNEFLVSWQTMARVVQTQIAIRFFNSLVQGLDESVDKAKELGLAIEEVQTIMGRKLASSTLEQQLLNMSDALNAPALDLTEGLYQTLSNQVVEAADSMKFLETATKLARVTTSDTKSAVNALSSVMNSYGYEAEKAGHVSDTFFKTVELGRLRLEEVGDIIGRVTPLTSAMGVEWEEAAAAIAVMTRQGVKADTAITQLRAIMTKIIRPTKEMRAIFHQWGVEDGKQAVETFGGLGGVLKKLAKETGGSSEAMADLLRRVRTIVGQLSLMNDGGVLLAETMGELKNATGEVNSQWEEFTKSDAYRLEKATNQLSNSMTRLGATALPAVAASMEAINDFLELQKLGWKSLLGMWDDAGIQQEVLRRIAKTTAEELEASNKDFAERQKKRYEGLVEAQAKYYAEAQKEEFKLAAIRDDAIERANTAVQDQGKTIVDYYKSATKELEKFIEGVNAKIKSNAEKVADIDQKINARKLKTELDQARGNYAKLRILESELSKQRQKASKAAKDVGLSDESKERALKENQIAIDLAEQAKQLAASKGHSYTISKWESVIQNLLKDRKKVYESQNTQLKKAKPHAESLYKTMADGEKRLAELIKQRNKLYEGGDLQGKNAEQRELAQRRLNEIEKEIAKILSDAGRGDAFFKSLKLDANLPKITTGITEALNDAHKDWAAEVQRAKAAFASATIPIKVAIDPGDIRKDAAGALGVERGKGQGEVSSQRSIDAAALKVAQEYEAAQNQIANKEMEITRQLSVAGQNLKQNVAYLEQRFKGLKATTEVMGSITDLFERPFASAAEKVEILNGKVAKSTELQIGGAIKINAALEQARQQTIQGVAATKQQIEAWRGQILLLQQSGQLTTEQAGKMRSVVDAIADARLNAEALNNIQKKQPEKGKYEAAKKVTEELQRTKEAADAEAAAQGKTEQSIRGSVTGMNSLKGATQQTKGEMQGAAVSANQVDASTSTVGATAAAQVGGVIALAQAYAKLAEQARAAAQAAAAAAAGGGGAALAYHGGSMARYFADGGLVPRGEDRIMTALSRGETVINSRNSKRFFSELNAINQGSQPVYREQGGPVTNVGDVNVTVNGGDSSQQSVREIAHALRREIKRGTITLR